ITVQSELGQRHRIVRARASHDATQYEVLATESTEPDRFDAVLDYEYRLYKSTLDYTDRIRKRFRDPLPELAPCAVHELWRLGRVSAWSIPLVPLTVPHWQKIPLPQGSGWLNLNQPAVKVFSDADFPE